MKVETIKGTVRYPAEYRVTLTEPDGKSSWLVYNIPAQSPLGNDDLDRAAARCRALGHQAGDQVTLSGIRGSWWSGQAIILMINDNEN